MIRLVIGDGHPLSRRGVRLLLEEQPDLAVVGEASDAARTLALAVSLQPDVMVLDAGMPRQGALEAAAALRAECPRCEVLIVSAFIDEHLVADVFAAGAHGFLVTWDRPEDLLAAVRALAQHTPFISPTVQARSALLASAAPKLDGKTLTQREREIVQLIAEGLRTREIAVRLQISEKTVETHRAAIFRKLDLDTLADVVRYAIRNALVEL